MTTTRLRKQTTVYIDHTSATTTLVRIISGQGFTPRVDSEGDALLDFTVWKSRQGWCVTANGDDVDMRKTRDGAVNAALRMAGINRRRNDLFDITEDREY